jgi:SAM-dependent methyltransferase
VRDIQARLQRAIRAFRSGPVHPRARGVDQTDNVTYNRQYWDWYAERWRDPAFRAANADTPDEIPQFQTIGDEWGRRRDVEAVVGAWILPFAGRDAVVGEIGCGGGRVARQVAEHVKRLYCFDVSERMLDQARKAVPADRARFVLLEEARLPAGLAGELDFIYAFDVFLHLDLYVMWQYLQEMARVLRPGGHALVHTTNLTSEIGWRNFTKFERYRVETHFYVSPETVRTIADRAGLRLVREAEPDPGNFYLSRDYLAIFKRP